MKKEYMKPAMRVVKTQQHHILCSSPGSQTSIQMYNDAIEDEEQVW